MIDWRRKWPSNLKFLPFIFLCFSLLTGCTGSTPDLGKSSSENLITQSPNTTSSASKSEDQTFHPFAGIPSPTPSTREIISNPNLADVLKSGELPEMFLGRPDAPVTMIMYASLSCPYCRAFMHDVFPQLNKEYIDKGKVRFIVREFPIGKSSGNATIALRCAPSDKYFVLFSKYLENQPLWVSQDVRLEQIFSVAQEVGMKRDKLEECLQNQPMIEALKGVKDRGRTLGVVGTPNFFIQNILVKKILTMDEIRAMVDPFLVPVRASTLTQGTGSN
ncbi:MAG: DsbA family protein [Hyphomicrobium sp.]